MPDFNITFIRFKNTPFGGAERYLQRLTKGLESQRIDTKTVHADLPSWLPSWIRVLLFNRKVCRRKKKSDLYFSLDRATCCDIYRAGDGVHRAFLQTKGFSLNPLHRAYLWLERRTFANARLIIANSRMVKEQILHYYPDTDAAKIRIVYNGVPIPERFDKPKAKAALVEELGLDPRRPILLFVGSGFQRKGVEEFLRIIASLKTPVQAVVVGKEKNMRHYRQLTKKLGIAEQTHFTGPRKDVERFYEAADLFLFPTRYEPFSNVVLEAMSYAAVAVTTAQNGAAEVLPERFVMSQPDDMSINTTIETLLRNKNDLQKVQQEARSIAENYSIERNVDETLQIIRECATILDHETK